MSERKVLHINLRDLILIGVGLLLLCLLIPPLFKIIVILVALGIIIYAIKKFPKDIFLTSKKSVYKIQVLRSFRNYDVVELRRTVIEIGKGDLLARIGKTWVRAIELFEEIPDSVRDVLSKDELILVVESCDKKLLVVRGEDPEKVEDRFRTVCTMLETAGVRFRVLNSEEVIKQVLSLFRM